jgi:hypothetical protein
MIEVATVTYRRDREVATLACNKDSAKSELVIGIT